MGARRSADPGHWRPADENVEARCRRGVRFVTRPLRAVRWAGRGRDCRGQVAFADSRRPHDVRSGWTSRRQTLVAAHHAASERGAMSGEGRQCPPFRGSASEGSRGLPTVGEMVAEFDGLQIENSQVLPMSCKSRESLARNNKYYLPSALRSGGVLSGWRWLCARQRK